MVEGITRRVVLIGVCALIGSITQATDYCASAAFYILAVAFAVMWARGESLGPMYGTKSCGELIVAIVVAIVVSWFTFSDFHDTLCYPYPTP